MNYEGFPHFYYKTELDITYSGIHGEIVFADEEAFLTGSADFWANNQ